MIIRRNNFPFKRMKASPHLQFIAFRNHIGDFFDSVKIFQTDITYKIQKKKQPYSCEKENILSNQIC